MMLIARELLSRCFVARRICVVGDQSGATAIEYSLLAALIGVLLYLGLEVYYEALTAVFNIIITSLRNALG